MSRIPVQPFRTANFAPRGGGIDFLGMRAVNLRILQEQLIPGINNATTDLGTYLLATWIPWQFQRLAKEDEFRLSNYDRFRQAIEVAMAHVQRDDSPANNRFGSPRLRIGVQQKIDLTKPLTFDDASRKETTSVFAAPLYGPSLRHLQLIAGNAVARDGTSTRIPMVSEDDATTTLVESVDAALRACQAYEHVSRLDITVATSETLDDLGLHGLHPCFHREVEQDVKLAFLQKLFVPRRPGDGADQRRLTARLICESIEQHTFSRRDELRACWYSGLLPTGGPLSLSDADLHLHRERWALFQARQIQRTVAELFLKCFEVALNSGADGVEGAIDHWQRRSPDGWQLEAWDTFEQFVRHEAEPVSTAASLDDVSIAWHDAVHGDHSRFDDIPEGDPDAEFVRACRMLARWWIRMRMWRTETRVQELLDLGDWRRMSMRWFGKWLDDRVNLSLLQVARDILSEVVFSQHIKVALSRFDGRVQRLRFTLGDSGIVQTAAGKRNIGKSTPRLMDRLASFLGLLVDVDVIRIDEGGRMTTGPLAALAMNT